MITKRGNSDNHGPCACPASRYAEVPQITPIRAASKSTQAYIHADMKLKEQALARMTPAGIPGGRYAPSDPLLAFLENL